MSVDNLFGLREQNMDLKEAYAELMKKYQAAVQRINELNNDLKKAVETIHMDQIKIAYLEAYCKAAAEEAGRKREKPVII